MMNWVRCRDGIWVNLALATRMEDRNHEMMVVYDAAGQSHLCVASDVEDALATVLPAAAGIELHQVFLHRGRFSVLVYPVVGWKLVDGVLRAMVPNDNDVLAGNNSISVIRLPDGSFEQNKYGGDRFRTLDEVKAELQAWMDERYGGDDCAVDNAE